MHRMKARNENRSGRLQNPPPAAATAIAQRKRAERTQQALLALGARLSATRSSPEAARAIYAAADSLWKWDAGAVALWLPDSGHVETVLACDLVDGQRCELVPGLAAGPAAAGIRRIMDAGAELTLRKPGDSPGCDFVPFGNAARRPASIMCAPMRAESKTVGVLSIQSYTPNAFTQEHLRTLQVLADYCAGAFARFLAEEALRQREEMSRAILATAMDGYYALDFAADPRGAIVDVNEAFCRLTGYSSEELLQMRITDLEAAESPADVVRHSQKIIQARGDRFETRHRRKDGREIHIEICTSHVLGSQGRIFGFVRDIGERKRVEAEINRQSGLISSLLDSIPDIVFFKDVNGVYLGCNPPFAQFVGRSRDEIIGRTDYDLFDKRIADFFREHDQHMLESCQARHNEEWITYPDGRKMLVDTLKTPYRGPDGTLIGVLGISRDITERKRAEQQLAEALDLNQKMIASSTVGIAAYKASGECVFANETLARMVGGSLSEVHGGDFRRLEFWQESGLVQIADQVLSLGQARSIEIFGTTRFGKTLAADCHVTPFVSHGQPHLLFGLLDISERQRADALLRAQRDVGVGLSLTSDITVALKRFLEVAVQVAGLDCGGLYRLKPATQAMELAAHYGLSDAFVKAVTHYSAGDPETKLVLQGQSVFTAFRNLPAARSAAGLHEGLRAIAIIPLSHNRRVIGALNLASHTAEDIPMQARIVIEAMATQAAGAIARINAENESHRLERQLIGITDREHARMGQDIHDGLCQQLVSLALDANALRHRLAAARRPEAAQARRIADYLDRAITEARQLSRGLFPVRLEHEGLPPALEELAAATRDRFKIRCRFTSAGPVAVASSVTATHLYRIAQEAVTNAVKHSRAGSVAIRLRARAGALELSVTDNGAGLSAARRNEATGMGLQIMDYRARTIGGTLQFGPGPRGGTKVYCCVPTPVSGVSGA